MKFRGRPIALLAAVVAVAAVGLTPAGAQPAPTTSADSVSSATKPSILTASLSAGRPTDPRLGWAQISVNAARNQLCWKFSTTGVSGVTSVDIVRNTVAGLTSGQADTPVLTLGRDADVISGSGGGCLTSQGGTDQTFAQIVNPPTPLTCTATNTGPCPVQTVIVRTSTVPAGAARGTLTAGDIGYRLFARDGGVFAFGAPSPYLGSMPQSFPQLALNAPVVDGTAQSGGRGYWMVGRDGGVFTFGPARFLGSMGGIPLNQPIVGIASTPSGNGYWLAAADGGVFSFGDAAFWGSLANLPLDAPIVDIAATNTGRGYWMVSARGRVYAIGDAGAISPAANTSSFTAPVVGMAPTPTGRGYVLVSANGEVAGAGDAVTFTSSPKPGTVTGIMMSPTGRGYIIIGRGGIEVFAGDVPQNGDLSIIRVLNQPVVAGAFNS